MTTQQLDEAKQLAFTVKMTGILNGGSLALMCSIGHQTGLFDKMADLEPSTSQQIADAAGLNERYVREWLGAMVTGGIVDYERDTAMYSLPPEHAASITRAAGPGNLASLTQVVGFLAAVEEPIVECFRNGGGVPYSSYPNFQEMMKEQSAAVFDGTLLQRTVPLVPGLVERLNEGIDAADVGCGSGHAINLMARAFPNSRFTGYDFSEEGVAAGKEEATAMGLTNATFEAMDAATLGDPARFDWITTFDAIHDQANPARVLQGISDLLRPDGVYLCVDVKADSNVANNVEHPMAPFMYTISTMHCMTVSLALDGEGLGTVWGEQKALEMLAEAGFSNVSVETVEGDMMNNYYVARRA
jgi:SAM-dependent methyltransferase